MFVWPEGDQDPTLVNNLVRMSQGKMMGVDFNKEKTWVGSSIALHSVAYAALQRPTFAVADDCSAPSLHYCVSSAFVSAKAFTANSRSSRECAAET